MKMRQIALCLLLSGLVVVGYGQGQASVIPALFNTGDNASDTPLPDGTIGDLHYSLVSVPSGSTTTMRVRTSAGGYPIPPYFGNDSKSAWIGPNNDPQLDGPVGNYDYQVSFSLSGFNPNTASITGVWSSDNNGVAILLNGVNTGNPGTSFLQFQIGFVPFSITTGFHAGVNTLDFIVFNGGGPTALRVEMTGAAAPTTTPEPSSLALLGTGLVGVAGLIRRKVVQ